MDSNKEKPAFRPSRIRDLSWKGHFIILFCLLSNMYVGWHFYSVLLDNDAGDFDDNLWLRDAERRDTLAEIFDPTLKTGNEAMDGCYLPIQAIVYHWSVNVIGPRLLPARVLGIWVHLLSSLLIFIIVYRFSGSIPGSHLTSLFFILHPRMVETISWLSASVAHGLVWFFFLAAFLLFQTYMHDRGWWRYVFGIILFLLAVMTKELAATLFAIVLLYDVIVVFGLKSLWPIKPRFYLRLFARHIWLFLVVLFAVGMQLFKYEGGYVDTKFGGTDFGLRAPLRIVELLAVFFQLGPAWDRVTMLWVMAAITSALFFAFYVFRHKPVLLFIALWIPISMTPYSFLNFRAASSLGRYTYEAGSIIVILFGLLVIHIVRKWRYLEWPVLSAILIIFLHFATRISGMIR